MNKHQGSVKVGAQQSSNKFLLFILLPIVLNCVEARSKSWETFFSTAGKRADQLNESPILNQTDQMQLSVAAKLFRPKCTFLEILF